MSAESDEWERFRKDVEHSAERDPYERRLAVLEQKTSRIEVETARQLSQLSNAFDTLASAIDRLVTRTEFEPIRLLVYGLCVSVMTVLLATLLARGWFR